MKPCLDCGKCQFPVTKIIDIQTNEEGNKNKVTKHDVTRTGLRCKQKSYVLTKHTRKGVVTVKSLLKLSGAADTRTHTHPSA